MFQNFQIEWIVRLFCALLAGTIIGQERQNRSKEAGVRTHALVAMAACILMIISKYGFADTEKYDAARVAAQVVSGISFLGAGLIFVRNDFIQGLTTAAGVWATSAIGLCFGTGMYILGIVGTTLVYLIQTMYHDMFQVNHLPRSNMELRLHLTQDATAQDVFEALKKTGYAGTEYRFRPRENGWLMDTDIYTFMNVEPVKLITQLESFDKIEKAELLK